MMEMIKRFCTTLEHPWLILWLISPFSLFSLSCSSSSSPSSFVSSISCVFVSLSHFFVSFLYHLMNTIFQCCMKTSNHFHLTRSTTIQLSLFCCLSSHSKHFFKKLEQKQGWIHGNLVVEGLAGAAMRKPLAIQKCYGLMDGWTDGRTDGWTDGRTNRHGKV